jgi:hypothetical protein
MHDLEKNAWIEKLPGMAKLGKAALLQRVAATLGPHASEGLRMAPHELEGLYRMLSNVPKGGTLGAVDLSQVAPGFTRHILKGKQLSGEMLNRLLAPSRRSILPPAAPPDTIAGQVLQSMRKNPLMTLLAGGGLGLATHKLLKKNPPAKADAGPASKTLVVT